MYRTKTRICSILLAVSMLLPLAVPTAWAADCDCSTVCTEDSVRAACPVCSVDQGNCTAPADSVQNADADTLDDIQDDSVPDETCSCAAVCLAEACPVCAEASNACGLTAADPEVQTYTLTAEQYAEGEGEGEGETSGESENSQTPAGTELTQLSGILASGTYYLAKDLTLTDTLTVNANVTINLNGHVLSGNKNSPVIKVSGGSLIITSSVTTTAHYGRIDDNGLWVWNGSVTSETVEYVKLTGGVITGGYSDSSGGGIRLDSTSGTLTMSNVTMAGNWANNSTNYNDGGAILVHPNSSFATLTNVTLCYNAAKGSGGGISCSGTLTMTDCNVTNNTAEKDGGGIASYGDTAPTITLINTKFSGNHSPNGESNAIYLNNGTVALDEASVEGIDSVYAVTPSKLSLPTGTAYIDIQKPPYGTYIVGGIRYICFDLNAGAVTINGSTYTGYVYGTGGTAEKVSGTHTAANHYYIYQSTDSQSTDSQSTDSQSTDSQSTVQSTKTKSATWNDDGTLASLPSYNSMTYNGEPWSDYITNNSSVEAVIDNWATAADTAGRTSTENKISISGSKDVNVVFDNLWSSYAPDSSSDGPVSVKGLSNKAKVTIRLKGDSRFWNIYYQNTSNNDCSLVIDSFDNSGGTSGSMTVAALGTTMTRDSSTDWPDCLAVIGAANSKEYGLTFAGGTVFAGFPAQNNHVWDKRTDVAFATCVGGGNNEYGEVTITGGRLTAVTNGTSTAIGGGGGYNLTGGAGQVNISGGEVYAYAFGIYSTASDRQGFVPSTAIGGSTTFDQQADEGTVNITGGQVYAESLGGVAIGGGSSRNSTGGKATVTISGGTVTAISSGGTANDGAYTVEPGNAIGGGNGTTGGTATVTISGDSTEVTATAIGGGTGGMNDKNTTNVNGGNATVTIKSGSVTAGTVGGGTTLSDNDNAHIGFARVTILGGTISAQFLLKGYLTESATEDEKEAGRCIFQMSGGTIQNVNTSDKEYPMREEDGGAVWMDDLYGQVTISGNATIQGCSARRGGAIYMTAGEFTMTGGTISDNTATGSTDTSGDSTTETILGDGGGIYLGSGNVTITEDSTSTVTISGNSAKTGNGGGVYVGGGSFSMTGGTVSGNSACNWDTLNSMGSGNGGGIYVRGGNLTLNNGTVSENSCSRFGGGIYIYAPEKAITLAGGTISNNKAAQSGGGLTAFKTNVNLTKSSGGSGVKITGNESVNGGGLYLRYNATLTMKGGTITGNKAVSLKIEDSFYSAVANNTAQTDLTLFGSQVGKEDYGGNGGGVFIHNATMKLDGSGVISNNTADRNGGGLYIIQSKSTDSNTDSGGTNNGNLAVTIQDGEISGNTAGLHGGGIAMFQPTVVNLATATADISGQVQITGNCAQNGGGFYVGGGTLTVTGGIMTGNKATATKTEMQGLTTASNPDANVGVGGGIYVYNLGTLYLQISSTDSQNQDTNSSNSSTATLNATGNGTGQDSGTTDAIGVYDNEADFAANDVYCAQGTDSTILLPSVKNMYLKDYAGHVIGKVDGWFLDYPNNDTTNTNSSGRYDDSLSDTAKKEFEIENASKELTNYTCLTLGFTYTRVTVKISKEIFGADLSNKYFNFDVTIQGQVSAAEKGAGYNQSELVFNGEGYTIDDNGATSGSAKVSFSLKGGEYVLLEGVPVGSTVTITEKSEEGTTWSTVYFLDEESDFNSTHVQEVKNDPIEIRCVNFTEQGEGAFLTRTGLCKLVVKHKCTDSDCTAALPEQHIIYCTPADLEALVTELEKEHAVDGHIFKSLDVPSALTAGTTISAKWTRETFTLTYVTNGGSEIQNDTITAGTTVNLNEKITTKAGHTFSGWYSDEALTQAIHDVQMATDTTVYAKWEVTKVPTMLSGGSDTAQSEADGSHLAYIIGFADDTVRPLSNISRAEVGVIFFRLLSDEVRDSNLTTENSFADVTEGMWCNTALSTMEALGIINGRSSTCFDPDAPITRAEFAAICARFDTGTEVVEGSHFTDIQGHWAQESIERAAALGWILGYTDGTFRPEQYITRAEVMAIINRMLGRMPESEEDLLADRKDWSDNPQDAWYYLDVCEATDSHTYRNKAQAYETWKKLIDDPDWKQYQ